MGHKILLSKSVNGNYMPKIAARSRNNSTSTITTAAGIAIMISKASKSDGLRIFEPKDTTVNQLRAIVLEDPPWVLLRLDLDKADQLGFGDRL